MGEQSSPTIALMSGKTMSPRPKRVEVSRSLTFWMELQHCRLPVLQDPKVWGMGVATARVTRTAMAANLVKENIVFVGKVSG